MVHKTRVYNWYAALTASCCMVLYGYDAAVFNAVQANKLWLAYYSFDVDSPVSRVQELWDFRLTSFTGYQLAWSDQHFVLNRCDCSRVVPGWSFRKSFLALTAS